MKPIVPIALAAALVLAGAGCFRERRRNRQ